MTQTIFVAMCFIITLVKNQIFRKCEWNIDTYVINASFVSIEPLTYTYICIYEVELASQN